MSEDAPLGRVADDSRPPRSRRLAVAGGVALVALVATTGWWGPRVLAPLAFFHVRSIELRGVVYAPVPELLARLGVDSLQSVWQPLPPLAARVRVHPLVAEAEVRRQLPGTLVVTVQERVPVAWAGDSGGIGPVDGTGRRLPLDGRTTPLDLPVAVDADTALLRFLDALRRDAPGLFARVTAVARPTPREFRVSLGALRVRALPEVTVARFQDIFPVESDLARRHVAVAELDLRFRDQVIARTP